MNVSIGDKVLIEAKTSFYAAIDGVVGRVVAMNQGLVTVEVIEHEDTIEMSGPVSKHFLVPPDHLRATV